MRTGYKYAQRMGYDYAMQVDSDGQHHPESIPSLIKAVEDYDIVIGSRFADGAADYEVSGPRKWAMGLLSFLFTRAAGYPIHGCDELVLRLLTAAVSTSTAVTCPPNTWATRSTSPPWPLTMA